MSLQPLTATQLTHAFQQPSKPLLGPYLVAGQRTVILGETGAGKTTLALGLLSAALQGTTFLGEQSSGLASGLLLDCEQGPASLRRSLTQAGLGDSERLQVLSLPGGVHLDKDAGAQAELEALIASLRPSVVLCDPQYQLVSSDSRQAVLRLVSLLDRWRVQYGFALLLPMHPRKRTSTTNRRVLALDDVAGSGAALWNAELVLGLERLEEGHSLIRVLKDREAALGLGTVIGLHFDPAVGFTIEPTSLRASAEESNVPWLIAAACALGLIVFLLALAGMLP